MGHRSLRGQDKFVTWTLFGAHFSGKGTRAGQSVCANGGMELVLISSALNGALFTSMITGRWLGTVTEENRHSETSRLNHRAVQSLVHRRYIALPRLDGNRP